MSKWMSLAVMSSVVWCSSAFASKAYDDGVAEARADLKGGYAYVYSFGLMRVDGDRVHWSTGLPVEAIAGCVVDDSIVDRATGYNETVQAWIAEHGKPPANSLKPWEKELKDVVACFNAAGQAKPVPIGAEPLRVFGDADEKHAISITAPNEKGEHYLVLATDAGEVRHLISPESARGAVVKAGPTGSMTVLLRTPGREGEEMYQLYELRRGKALIWKSAPVKDA